MSIRCPLLQSRFSHNKSTLTPTCSYAFVSRRIRKIIGSFDSSTSPLSNDISLFYLNSLAPLCNFSLKITTFFTLMLSLLLHLQTSVARCVSRRFLIILDSFYSPNTPLSFGYLHVCICICPLITILDPNISTIMLTLDNFNQLFLSQFLTDFHNS